ncbi:hypothetical protein [Arthrobacter luteolus]|uniref:hypothetical protein n=1 Tax=Arthrobacter luteolus TaxID=98672 RepID=UPI00384E7F00
MDDSVWKLVVDRAIAKTDEGTMKWVASNHGPVRTVGFTASIDETTTLSFWGYERNFSYEICLTKETGGEPFVEIKRITTQKKSGGIRCNVLLDAVQRQTIHIPRLDAFKAVMEYVSDPLADRSDETQEDLINRWGKLESLGWNDFFLYSQTREILRALTTLTTEGTIIWSLDTKTDEEAEWSANVGDLLRSSLSVKDVSNEEVYAYTLWDVGDGTLWVGEGDEPDAGNAASPLRSPMKKLHEAILRMNPTDDVKFETIVRENIVQEILAALDVPRA